MDIEQEKSLALAELMGWEEQEILSVCLENDELKAWGNELREGIKHISLDTAEVPEGLDPTCYKTLTYEGDVALVKKNRELIGICMNTPAQSLAAHDRKICEECAEVCERYAKGFDNEWNHNLGKAADLMDTCKECAEAIREKAKEVSDE